MLVIIRRKNSHNILYKSLCALYPSRWGFCPTHLLAALKAWGLRPGHLFVSLYMCGRRTSFCVGDEHRSLWGHEHDTSVMDPLDMHLYDEI